MPFELAAFALLRMAQQLQMYFVMKKSREQSALRPISIAPIDHRKLVEIIGGGGGRNHPNGGAGG